MTNTRDLAGNYFLWVKVTTSNGIVIPSNRMGYTWMSNRGRYNENVYPPKAKHKSSNDYRTLLAET